MSDVLVTGATGFVGSHVVAHLRAANLPVRCAVRSLDRARDVSGEKGNVIAIGPIGSHTEWSEALREVSCVVHLAARVHVLEERIADPLAAFVEVNTLGTLRLARAAAAAGVRRFIFMSSVKVNGESSGARAFSAIDVPAPVDPYGISKLRAEQGLADIARETGMGVIIIRPPLVYGPGVGANFLRLVRLVDRGMPLPIASVHNSRSLVSVWNLCDLLARCIVADNLLNGTFMVSDGADLSTAALVRQLAVALGRAPRLIGVPVVLLRLAARMTGQMAEYTRLCASLSVDMSATMATLDWRPPCSVEESLARTIQWYRRLS